MRTIEPNDMNRMKLDFENRKHVMNAEQIKAEIRNWYAYQGPLGEVVCNGRYFFAWKDGCLIGTSKILEEVMESLVWREMLKPREIQ
jgi:hypothetical protein